MIGAEVVPESTEEDLGDPDESSAAALAAFKQPFFSVQPPFLLVEATLKSAFSVEGPILTVS